MKLTTGIITRTDFDRLSAILEAEEEARGSVILRLEEKLLRAAIVETSDMPRDVVTMNSRFRGIMSGDREASNQDFRIFTLVYPREADIAQGRISIMAPIGAELLGARAGETVVVKGQDGQVRTFFVDEVLYQPEASGDWHL